jgi:hypothetical protein
VAVALSVAFIAWRASAFGATRHSRPLLLASGGWLLYAAWEWLVQLRTPEANIRFDLLIIWPVLAILSAWAILRALR